MISKVAFAVACFATFAAAQNLVRDINRQPSPPDGSSHPGHYAVVGNRAFFRASTPATGAELFVTDGTATGTKLVADIRPGTIGSNPFLLTPVGTSVYFVCNDGSGGSEVWRVDAQLDVSMVRNIAPGSRSSTPRGLVALGSKCLFSADDGRSGRELWVSEGTPLTTRMVADIRPGSSSSSPGTLVRHGSLVYFAATTSGFGRELWRSAGTQISTGRVADIRRGSGSSSPAWLRSAARGLYFVADDGVHGRELWVASVNTARLVTDIRSGASSSSPQELTAVGADLFCTAFTTSKGRELYRVTSSGARLERDIYPGAASSSPMYLAAFGGDLYCAATHPTWGRELWKVSSSGANPFTDLADGTASSTPRYLTAAGSRLYFRAAARGGDQLWSTTGHTSSTSRVSNRATNGKPTELTPLGSRLLYSNDDELFGREPHITDGNDEDVIENLAAVLTAGSGIGRVSDFNGLAVFPATDGSSGTELWRSDGTADGTFRLGDLNPGDASSDPQVIGVIGGSLWFTASTAQQGRELWRTDGTVAGTSMFQDLRPGPEDGADSATLVGETVYFIGTDSTNGRELWKTDGTISGTGLIRNIGPGPSSGARRLTRLGSDRIFFLGNDGTHGWEPWRSDGTRAGTVMIADTVPGSDTGFDESVYHAASFGTRVAFHWNRTLLNADLWSTDGTAAGTHRLDLASGFVTANTEGNQVACGSLFYFRVIAGRNPGLWRTNGTNAGTIFLHALPNTLITAGTTCSGTTVFFAGSDGEPWRSDGTRSGTRRITDIWSGGGSLMEPYHLLFSRATLGGIGASGHAALRARNAPGENFELWTTDGSVGGTTLRKEIRPGPTGSYPGNFATVGDKLFFTADDGTHGQELWVMPLATIGAGHLAFYNTGCRGTLGTPHFTATRPPRLGRPFTSRVTNARPGTAALFALGLTRQNAAHAGCRVLNELLLTLPTTTDGRGETSLVVPVASDKNWLGRSLFLQGFVFDPGARWLGTFALTAGQQAVIGNK